MSKMKFSYDYKEIYGNGKETTLVFETNSDALPDILEDFSRFLRGCGFDIKVLAHVDEDEE